MTHKISSHHLPQITTLTPKAPPLRAISFKEAFYDTNRSGISTLLPWSFKKIDQLKCGSVIKTALKVLACIPFGIPALYGTRRSHQHLEKADLECKTECLSGKTSSLQSQLRTSLQKLQREFQGERHLVRYHLSNGKIIDIEPEYTTAQPVYLPHGRTRPVCERPLTNTQIENLCYFVSDLTNSEKHVTKITILETRDERRRRHFEPGVTAYERGRLNPLTYDITYVETRDISNTG